jgi:alkaline phosphatase D
MRRGLIVVAAMSALLALPSAASAAFTLGVASGEIRSTTAQVWGHSTTGGPVIAELSLRRSFIGPKATHTLIARATNDNNVQVVWTGLLPNRTYYYRFVKGSLRSQIGTFHSAPSATANQTIRFALSGDADAQKAPGATAPFYNRFEVYRRMALEHNTFNVNMGDTIYSDSEVPGAGALATTVAQKWAKYRQNLALPNLANFRGATGLYSHWDDHEFVNDYTRFENGSAIYASGVKAFRDYAPVHYTASEGLYRSFRWGANLEVFFLDERSFRSAKAPVGGACTNGGREDLAPTAPQNVRNIFAALVPSLRNPPPPYCLTRLYAPNRTMLGPAQYARFTRAVDASTARFKVIMNEVPIQQFFALPYDRWEGYEFERIRLVNFLRNNVKNVVFLTTDDHANLINGVHLRTLGPQGPDDNKGIFEFTTGPVATMSFSKEISGPGGANNPNAGSLVTKLFFLGNPPNGLAMRCAATDVFSYLEVSVNRFVMRFTPKDGSGRLVTQPQATPANKACGPFVIPYRP